jgi:5-(carboxyamino)imidazole ribonucleotide synthase
MLTPGATIGILGGGQLAQMLALAAATLGLRCHIFAPPGDHPAFAVAAARTEAAYDDAQALAAFAASVDVVTYEFENVPAGTAAILVDRVPVRPRPEALAITQDRWLEKSFIRDLGLPTPAFLPIDGFDMLEEGVATLGRPSVLKTRRMGYDGKGQVLIGPETDLRTAFAAIAAQPAILEAFVPFSREVSVVAARAADGSIAAFDLCENAHKHHILALTRVPAAVAGATAALASAMAGQIAARLDYVGVLAVELFVLETAAGETLLINEIAPRVHNSGHWTIEGADTSQFEQHMRAIAGWPLGSTARRGRIEMENLIGEDVARFARILGEPGAHLHLYGKGEARPGRKMGHVTRIFDD